MCSDHEPRDETDDDGQHGGEGAQSGGHPSLGAGGSAQHRADTESDSGAAPSPDKNTARESALSSEPSIGKLEDREELPNGFTIGYFKGRWYAFDEKGKRFGPFPDRDTAHQLAFDEEPWREFGM